MAYYLCLRGAVEHCNYEKENLTQQKNLEKRESCIFDIEVDSVIMVISVCFNCLNQVSRNYSGLMRIAVTSSSF